MFYKVNIRKSFGKIGEDVKGIDGKIYAFVPSGYINGGHADGEVKMAPNDSNYPLDAPQFLALGDLEVID
jgi:hypothetical protein